jgi:hypothetical protein
MRKLRLELRSDPQPIACVSIFFPQETWGEQKKTTRKQPECVHKEEANMQTERLLNEEGEENY